MADMQKAFETQLANIEKRSGRTLAELASLLEASGLSKFAELRDFAKREFDLGHGDANALVHHARTHAEGYAAEQPADVLETIYSGAKSALRPIHDALIREIERFGTYETAPKKGYVSLRRKKQFAMLGPTTQTRVEVGLNMKGVSATDRLLVLPPGKMCGYKVNVTRAEEVDAELLAWIRCAYDSAG